MYCYDNEDFRTCFILEAKLRSSIAIKINFPHFIFWEGMVWGIITHTHSTPQTQTHTQAYTQTHTLTSSNLSARTIDLDSLGIGFLSFQQLAESNTLLCWALTYLVLFNSSILMSCHSSKSHLLCRALTYLVLFNTIS